MMSHTLLGQGVNVLLRDISKILFPNNPVNVPVIK